MTLSGDAPELLATQAWPIFTRANRPNPPKTANKKQEVPTA